MQIPIMIFMITKNKTNGIWINPFLCNSAAKFNNECDIKGPFNMFNVSKKKEMVAKGAGWRPGRVCGFYLAFCRRLREINIITDNDGLSLNKIKKKDILHEHSSKYRIRK